MVAPGESVRGGRGSAQEWALILRSSQRQEKNQGVRVAEAKLFHVQYALANSAIHCFRDKDRITFSQSSSISFLSMRTACGDMIETKPADFLGPPTPETVWNSRE